MKRAAMFIDAAQSTRSTGHVKMLHNRFMLSPVHTPRLAWDLAVITPLMAYLTIIMPFRICFNNDAEISSLVSFL